MKTSRYSTAGGGMLPRMSDSLPLFLSLMLSQCLSTPPLPFSLPDSFFPPLRRWKLSWPASQLSDAPLGEPDFTPDLTFTPQSILHSYIWVTHNLKKKIPIHLKFFYIIVILKKKYSQDKVFQYICENWPLAIDILPSERSPEGRICFSTTQISLILRAASENRQLWWRWYRTRRTNSLDFDEFLNSQYDHWRSIFRQTTGRRSASLTGCYKVNLSFVCVSRNLRVPWRFPNIDLQYVAAISVAALTEFN